jgi:hypothetical protein
MMPNLPTGLEHVLEVVRLVLKNRMNRIVAVKQVAKKRRIDPQTITSACTRSIGLTTRHLDDLLDRDSSQALCQHLVRRFPGYQDAIDDFFAGLAGSLQPSSPKDTTRIVKTLFPDEWKQHRDALLLNEARESVGRWVRRGGVPEDLQREIQDLHEKLRPA